EALILECATAHPRCIKDPEPRCYLRNFGDSSVDFILHFWVDDITAGRWQPQSEVMHAIWNAFKEHNIEIPFPQRDVHIFQEQA
ncbi:MAG: mechanosensitive ion channel protein MscS, partial [Pseudomonadota bacterium]|nr:mechanosensitive ion channel protein MscS [Pseudomonadota bacterium]